LDDDEDVVIAKDDDVRRAKNGCTVVAPTTMTLSTGKGVTGDGHEKSAAGVDLAKGETSKSKSISVSLSLSMIEIGD
jgi:hypothetical protein